MQKAIELQHKERTLRGMEHIPERAAGDKLPAVILYHGFTGNKLEPHRMFLKISRALEDIGFASYRFDFLGSGESDGNFEEMTVSNEIEEAKAILDFVRENPRIDNNRIGLLGFSMGGLIASIVAGDRSAEVERLVLMAPAGNMNRLVKQMEGIYGELSERPFVDFGGNLVGRAFAEDVKAIDVLNRAKNYKGPVCLIHGTEDASVPSSVSSMYQERCYGESAQIHFIEGADHTFNKWEWETEVIQSITDFFSNRR